VPVFLQGVDAVSVVTPGHIDRAKIVIAAVDAAKAAGVKVSLLRFKKKGKIE